jgi:DNA-binding transcriptional ArsR family regulator
MTVTESTPDVGSVPERSNASALAVERAAEILLLLAQSDTGSLSVSELARETKASGSAIHRILTALRRKQLVDQHPVTQRYALSWRMLTLFRQMNSRADIRGVVYPYMVSSAYVSKRSRDRTRFAGSHKSGSLLRSTEELAASFSLRTPPNPTLTRTGAI